MATRAADRSPDPSGVLRWLRRALVAAILVPVLLFAGAAWYDWQRLLNEAAGNARHTAALLREHALKAIETPELLIRHLDRRIRGMSWDDIRANERALSAE